MEIKMMKRAVVIVAGLMFVNMAFAGDSVKQAILDGNAKLMKAFGSDAQLIASLYTQGGQLMPAGSEAIEGHAEIAKFWQSVFDAGIVGVTLETTEVSFMGDTAAEVGKLELRDKEEKVVDKGKYVVVWKLVDSTWKLHRDIWTSNVPPAK
jgi:ketosteroid isomerase-like protein